MKVVIYAFYAYKIFSQKKKKKSSPDNFTYYTTDIYLKSLHLKISHLFSLRQFRTFQAIPIFKSRDDEADMQFRNSWDARNPDQRLRNIL